MPGSFDNNLPRRLRFGRGVTGELPAELRRLGCTTPFVVTDAGVKAAGLLAWVTGPLGGDGMRHHVFDGTEPEPPFACVAAALASVRGASGIDAVVALGGGSVMDTAKLVAATLLDGREPALLAGIGKVGRRPLPLVCLPTTAGTGSEATPVAIFTDPRTGTKVGVVDPCLVPDVVLLDPELTDGLPPLPTAAAGMDALVHAMEAFIARTATPLARGLALEAARRIGPALPAVCRDGRNRPARDSMVIGADLAGLAFANSSCCAVHALALPLGGRFHIPHGVVTGCLAAETMRHNLPAVMDDVAAFAGALGWGDADPDGFPDHLASLADGIGLRKVLDAAAVPDTVLEELAREAVANRRLMDPNPREVTQSDAVAIYRRTLGHDA
ncbi:MAG TPA: iron-containing alcohol dehydrogenase [Opitutaceae bacterium]|nr:iron-containing alcohol dehydrogenase [Opitutaceae bacterium]